MSAKQGNILKELLDSKVIEAGSVPIDTTPIEGNITHLVNSDGLAKEFNKHNTEIILGGIYDVSANNDGAVFESLSALLGSSNLSTLIPVSVRHGGMSIRFVQTSDNKYVQYRLTNQNWSIYVNDWISVDEFATGEKVSETGVDDEPTARSNNLVKSGGVANKISELDEMTFGKHTIINNVENTWSAAFPVTLIAGNKYIISTTTKSGSAFIAFTNNSGTHIAADEIARLSYSSGARLEYIPEENSNYIWVYAGDNFAIGTEITIENQSSLSKDVQKSQ